MIVLNSRRKRSFRLSVSLLQAPGSSLRRAASIRRSLLVIPLLVRKKKQLSSFLHDLAPSERFYTDSASVPGLCCRAHCEGLNCESCEYENWTSRATHGERAAAAVRWNRAYRFIPD